MGHSDKEEELEESGSSAGEEGLSEENLVSEQDWLIELMSDLNYFVDPDGICFGIACAYANAILNDQVDYFNQRLDFLKQLPGDAVPKLIAIVNKKYENLSKEKSPKILEQLRKNKNINKLYFEYDGNERKQFYDEKDLKKKEEFDKQATQEAKEYYELLDQELRSYLNENENFVLDIGALLDEIAFSAAGIVNIDYQELFEKGKIPIFSDIVQILPVILSKNLEKKGGVQLVDIFSGAYQHGEKRKDLNQYFDSLLPYLQKANLKTNPVFMLHSLNHTTALGYNFKEKKWIYGDGNEFLAQFFKQNSDIANKVKLSFSENENSIFTTQVITSREDADELKKCIASWKQDKIWKDLHKVNKGKIRLKDSNGFSWFHTATVWNDISAFKKMIEFKINLEEQDDSGCTVLLMATDRGNLEVVNELLNAKVNKYHRDTKGKTALLYAIDSRNLDIFNKFLDAKLINQADDSGNSPLMNAAYSGQIEMVSLLLKNGAELNHQSENNTNALMMAVLSQNLEIVKLIKDQNVHTDLQCSRKNDGITPFLLSLIKENIEIIHYLLQFSPDLSIEVSILASNFIKRAKDRDCEEAVTQLFKQSDQKIPPVIKNFNALHLAAFNGHSEIVKILLEKGLDINSKTENGLVPLDLARAMNHLEVVKILICHDLDKAKSIFLNDDLVNVIKKEITTANTIEALAQVEMIFTDLKKLISYRDIYQKNYPEILNDIYKHYMANDKLAINNILKKNLDDIEQAKKAHQQQGLHQPSLEKKEEERPAKHFKKD